MKTTNTKGHTIKLKSLCLDQFDPQDLIHYMCTFLIEYSLFQKNVKKLTLLDATTDQREMALAVTALTCRFTKKRAMNFIKYYFDKDLPNLNKKSISIFLSAIVNDENIPQQTFNFINHRMELWDSDMNYVNSILDTGE